jgi:N-acetylneuraminic acid mutarotase
VFLNGKVYMPGGWLTGFTTVYDKMQILKTKTNAWSVDAQPMPTGTAQSSVCTDGSKIYVVDGIDTNGAVQSKLQIYDPAAPQGSRWSTGPAPSTPADGTLYSRDGGCAWIGGKLYLFGGQASTSMGTINGISGFTWAFDPNAGTWSDTGFSMPVPDWTFAYTQNSKYAFAAGGRDKNGTYLQNVSRFSPTHGWSKRAKLPTPPGAPNGTGLEWPGMGILNGSLAVFGGAATNGYQSRTLLCAMPCSSTGTWTNANKNLVTARGEFGSASSGKTLFAIDGAGLSGFQSTAEKTT